MRERAVLQPYVRRRKQISPAMHASCWYYSYRAISAAIRAVCVAGIECPSISYYRLSYARRFLHVDWVVWPFLWHVYSGNIRIAAANERVDSWLVLRHLCNWRLHCGTYNVTNTSSLSPQFFILQARKVWGLEKLGTRLPWHIQGIIGS